MNYSITIEIGKTKYDTGIVKSEASLDAENLPTEAMEQIIKAMILDVEKKANRKLADKTKAEVEPQKAPESAGDTL